MEHLLIDSEIDLQNLGHLIQSFVLTLNGTLLMDNEIDLQN